MKNRTLHLILASLLVLPAACIKEVDFSSGEPPGWLVVDGRITTNPGPQTIYLSQTNAFGKQERRPVSGAVIDLFDEGGPVGRYVESKEEEGRYLLDVRGEPGRTYHIEIKLPDERSYRSRPEKLLPVPKVDSLTYYTQYEEFEVPSGALQKKWFINVLAHTTLGPQSEGPYLRWEVETVHNFVEIPRTPPGIVRINVCYIRETSDPQVFRLYNGSRVNAVQPISLEVARRRITWVFEFRHYFNVYQSSLTESAYRYWSDIDRVSNPAGSIFDAPAAAVRGNVFNVEAENELVLGYFGASAIDTARVFTTRPDLPDVPIIPYCGTIFGRPNPVPPACYNCLNLPNSTYERPDYF